MHRVFVAKGNLYYLIVEMLIYSIGEEITDQNTIDEVYSSIAIAVRPKRWRLDPQDRREQRLIW